jgi:EmrB/QacA subfamily drug resistance transporter
VLVLTVGNFMAVLDITIVNVAIPAIQKDFGGSLDDTLWIATAYTLMLGVVVPVSSWLGERFGLTWVYIVSLTAFALGSLFCGIAGNLGLLIGSRVFQAVPGGIMPVVGMTLLYRVVPGPKLGAAMGVFGLGTVCGPAIGPVLGGYFVQYIDWRLVFFINIPVGLAGAVAAYVLLPRVPGRRGRRFDVPGFLSIGIGLFAILLAASEGEDWGWDGYRVRMLFVFGALCLALFVLIELEVDQPLLNLRVFRVWPFTLSLILLAILTINLLGLSFLLPVFLQQGQHKEAYDAGVLLLIPAVVAGALMPVVGRLYDRVGARWLAVSGLLLTAYGTYLFCDVTPDTTRFEVILWASVRGVGLGLSLMPVMTAGLAALPPAQTPEGSAWNNVARQTCGALGLAGLTVLGDQQRAQLMAGDAALVERAGPVPVDATGHITQETFARLYGRYLALSDQVLAVSYANLFLVVAALTGVGAVLALLIRQPARSTGPVDPGH